MSASGQDAEGSPPGRVSVRQLHDVAFPTFLQNTLAGGECQDFIMESFNCCTGTLGEMPRVFGSKCHFRLVTGFIQPLISEYLAPEYILYSKIWHYLQCVVRVLCVADAAAFFLWPWWKWISKKLGEGSAAGFGEKGETIQASGSACKWFFTQKESN